MGLLDDAIREHLELKRRHGADATEVSKLEKEAFGPVRRPDALEVPAAPPLPAEEAGLARPHEDELGAPEPVVERDPEPAAPVAPAPAGAEPLTERDPEPEAPVAPTPAARGADPAAPVSRLADEPGQETAGFSLADLEAEEARTRDEPIPEREPAPAPGHEPAADVVPADEEPGEDDVLEETPEFLQETPEHDRLWFEQKPPRDFDF